MISIVRDWILMYPKTHKLKLHSRGKVRETSVLTLDIPGSLLDTPTMAVSVRKRRHLTSDLRVPWPWPCHFPEIQEIKVCGFYELSVVFRGSNPPRWRHWSLVHPFFPPCSVTLLALWKAGSWLQNPVIPLSQSPLVTFKHTQLKGTSSKALTGFSL